MLALTSLWCPTNFKTNLVLSSAANAAWNVDTLISIAWSRVGTSSSTNVTLVAIKTVRPLVS